MLKSWEVQNFKSFKKKQSLTLSGINVFTGANSSGKSSIIQSMLLLKQTLQYGAPSRTLVLNGPILKLGTFDDVLNDDVDRQSPIGFNWNLSLDAALPARGFLYRREHWAYNTTGLTRRRTQELTNTDAKLSWVSGKHPHYAYASGHETSDALHPLLHHGCFSCTRNEEDTASSWSYELVSPRDGEYFDRQYSRNEVYLTDLDERSKSEITEDKPDAEIHGTLLHHFFPSIVEVKFDARAKKAIGIARGVTSLSGPVWSLADFDEDFEFPVDLVDEIFNWAAANKINLYFNSEEPTAGELRGQLAGRSSGNALSAIHSASRIMPELEDLEQIIFNGLMEMLEPEEGAELEYPRDLANAEALARAFFTSGVKYLGPLRDEPRPVYPLEALEDQTSVGYKGEHTAAILELHKEKTVYTLLPNQFSESGAKPGWHPLYKAVDEWANYMGLADHVSTKEHGVFGHQLKVETSGAGRSRDLTNVGVGVSQVLPILVLSLLAPIGSLLIFEQPELHLHPKMQARLADFFVATALSNKQCILETHSEYMVDRFRLRIVEDEGDAIRELINVFFVERDGAESNCRKVEISSYGALQEWPKDFFDQSQSEAEAIVRASLAKRVKP